ncbi:MAG: hypothetical protein HY788_21230 [Deltaproteobacteria bacterium]|nr:hypothetical protein [Deltaproteobacteria bacterium]
MAPGAKGNVTLSVNTKGLKGQFHKTANIVSNAPSSPEVQLELSGFVKNYIEVKPSTYVQLRSTGGKPASQTVEFNSGVPGELLFTKMEVSPGIQQGIETKLVRGEDKRSYTLEITSLYKEIGNNQGQILIQTNNEKKPEISLRIIAVVQGPIQVAPQRLHFGNVRRPAQPGALKRTIWLKKTQGADFKITGLEYDHDAFELQVVDRKPGEEYIIMVSLKPEKLKQGLQNETILIKTDHEEMKSISIPVVLVVQ